jgi:HrpA-like RNA helicase
VCGTSRHALPCCRDISGVLLQLKALGIDNVLRFPYLSPPPAKTMMNALEVRATAGWCRNRNATV